MSEQREWVGNVNSSRKENEKRSEKKGRQVSAALALEKTGNIG